MVSLFEIILGISITCLILAFVASIADGIWDRIEDDIAKAQENDIIKK